MGRTITGRRISSLLKLADSYGVALEFIGKDHGIVRVTSPAGTRIRVAHISIWPTWVEYLDNVTRLFKILSEDIEVEAHLKKSQNMKGDNNDY